LRNSSIKESRHCPWRRFFHITHREAQELRTDRFARWRPQGKQLVCSHSLRRPCTWDKVISPPEAAH
jgi:hypothetical protein